MARPNKYDNKQIEQARRAHLKAVRELQKIKNGRLALIFLVSVLFLIYPLCAVTSLVFLPISDAVPDWYTGLSGWLLRIFLLILWVVTCRLIWVRKKYREGIERKQEEIAKAEAELDKRRRSAGIS